MNIIKYKTTIFLICVMFMPLFSLLGQDAEGKVMIISERVGEVIDQGERKHFNLFPGIEGFQSAQFIRKPDGGLQILIKYIDSATGKEEIQRQYPTKLEIMQMSEMIDNYDQIKKGEYNYQYQQESERAVPNFDIQDSLVTVELRDGSTLKGSIVRQDEENIYFRTMGGMETTVLKSMIKKIKPMSGKIVAGEYQRLDPNYSRLMFAPTGRPLKKGLGYFSDYYVFFPGISYGFTNNISLMAGFSFIPGLSLGEQLKYVAPRIGIDIDDKFAISTGALYVHVDDVAAGIGFIVGTYGERDHSFTLGFGLGYTRDEENDFRFAEHPILMFGGNVRISNSAAFITENWIITGNNFNLSEQPFSIAVRFFGDRVSADVGFIIIGEVISEGFPIPWLSFVYNFGN